MARHAHKHGTIHIDLPFELPREAGRLDMMEVRRLAKPHVGLSSACQQAAHALASAPAGVVSAHVTGARLKELAEQVEFLEGLQRDIDTVANTVNQALLITRDEAYTEVRRLYMDVKASAEFDERARQSFSALYDYFTPPRSSRAHPSLPDLGKAESLGSTDD